MLTPKQQAFVDEYVIDLNATQAAIRAGYSPRSAGAIAGSLLQKHEIQLALKQVQEERSAKTKITAERVLQELARIAFFDPRNMLNADGSPKPIQDLDDDTAAVLAGMDIAEEYEGSGEDRVFKGYTKKVKLADKVAALNLSMRHLGMLTDKLEVKDVTSRADRLSKARSRKTKE